MTLEKSNEQFNSRIKKLESLISEQRFELEEFKSLLQEEKDQRQFYQLIADFTFGWELWFNPNGVINYCSPSCFDLTGFTANQIISSKSIAELLVYEPDQEKYANFLSKSLDQMVVSQTLDFRILTRTKQLRWCVLNVRGVYDRQGKYLGIR